MKECKFCQGTDFIIDKRNKTKTKRIMVDLDCNCLMVNFYDDKKDSWGSAQKNINFCPMCGRRLEKPKTLQNETL